MKKLILISVAFLLNISLLVAQDLISEGKDSWASTVEGGNSAANGNDGDADTRWESKHLESAWWTVDLGKEYHIFSVEFKWEAAYAKVYKIQLSNDRDFKTYVDIAHVINSPGGEETVSTDINPKGRYLRMLGFERAMGYGYSFYECRVYGVEKLNQVPVKIEVPYVQYLKMRLTPADVDGTDELTIQNKDEVIDLTFNEGSPLKLDLLDFRGNFDIDFWTLKEGTQNDSIKGIPLNVKVYRDMVIGVKLTPKITFGNQAPVADAGPDMIIYSPTSSVELDGSRSIDRDGEIVSFGWTQVSGAQATIATPNSAKTTVSNLALGDYKFQLTVVDNEQAVDTDEIIVSVLPPEQVDFNLTFPGNKAMITDTRRPTFTWEACADAVKYEVYVNITRNDYEWHVAGNLLDRYTKVGESTANSFTLQSDLVDRWTYKWYVIATTTSGMKYSDKKQFGLYIPYLEQENDGIGMVNGCRDMNKNGTIEPFEDWHLTPEERLDDIMSRLTTEEKISQLFYGGNENPLDGFAFSYGVEGGMRTEQYKASKTRMGIPIAFLGDKMHGWKTIYPTQLGLAATRDMDLAYQCGNLHRVEQKSFGFTGTLSPLAEVATKALYPRIQEGGGENADEVAAMVRALVCGMQGGPEVNPHSMMITVKHWPSQGAGGEGPTQYDEVTIKYHMKPWHATVDANAVSAMPGYSSSPFLDPSGAGANSSKKIIDYLKNEIKFKGFIVTDWLASNTEQSVESIGAGIDVLGGAPSKDTNFAELVAAVGMDRINEAVRRVLDVKIRMGMFENPYGDPTCTWTNAEHHQIVLNAARKSITLLKNDNVLPLKLNAGDEMVVGGPRATWKFQEDPNVIWQSIYYDNPQAKTYVKAVTDRATEDGIEVYQDNSDNPKVAVVVIGEQGYTHGTEWDGKNPNIPEAQLAVIRDFKNRGIKVITVVILPRPYVLTPVVEMSDAILAVYRGGNGIGQAVAECIFGDFAPTGKLPFQMPRSDAQIGTDDLNNQIERWELPYDLGATAYERELIRNHIDRGEQVPPIYGDPLFHYGYGIQGFGVEDTTPPAAFNLISPENSTTGTSTSITFTWEASSDPESSIAYYEVYIDGVRRAQVTNTNYTQTLLDIGQHTWYVNAVNGAGLGTASGSVNTFIIDKTSGVDSLNQLDETIVYPNPFSDKLFLSIPNQKDIVGLRIIDITGKTVLERNTQNEITQIELQHLHAGVYYLVLNGKESQKILKVIKQ
ncbi:T9SS C-terminal target domain-containing protein [Paludibacter sp. 221]|uniref:glycoside hydrolase family 3 N-terminal domain-containing protein n=1 Tax=Paludibacter sp. 221 TaxID=2302939 RepID=UPI0013D32D94|nr:glycoside hydrolase family 3 N-terminal domain-containing protein [Paludibacter sp. 221]NDV46808.1 T9SS C-terminal target domain-containing protein [Paludibacter sp. 221]